MQVRVRGDRRLVFATVALEILGVNRFRAEAVDVLLVLIGVSTDLHRALVTVSSPQLGILVVMTREASLRKVLDKAAERMWLDFEETAIIKHSGSKGTVREGGVQSFLADYMPRTVDVVGSGEIVAATGEVSGQCDVMVLDAEAPPLWAHKEYRIVPAECCYATIEVKSNLTRDELRKSWEAANLVKSLPRRAYLPDTALTTTPSGAALAPQVHVFAYSGISMSAVGEELAELAQRDPGLTQGVDSVCILDQGMLTWLELDIAGAGARRPGSRVAAYKAPPGEVLLYLTTTLSKYLAVATRGPRFDLTGYVTGGFGDLHGFWPGAPPEKLKAMWPQIEERFGRREED